MSITRQGEYASLPVAGLRAAAAPPSSTRRADRQGFELPRIAADSRACRRTLHHERD